MSKTNKVEEVIKIKKIIIEFKGKQIEGTLDELKELKDELDRLFVQVERYAPIPIYPVEPYRPIEIPQSPWYENNPPVITCNAEIN